MEIIRKLVSTGLLTLLAGFYFSVNAQQQLLTMERAMLIAQENSPDIKKSLMRMEQSQLNLEAQRASLKSKFSLTLNPVNYSQTRNFDSRFSQWYTNESFTSGGVFQVEQPILLTNGTISLRNNFSWQNNSSYYQGANTSNRVFSNYFYIDINQPIFTYNTQKMELERLEYDYENMEISYALQRLNTERNITQQFYSVYQSQRDLEISKEELVNSQQSHSIIKNKVEAELSPRDELYQAEVNLATARSSVDQAIVALENAKDQLKRTLGLDLADSIMVEAVIDVHAIVVDQEKAIDHGLGSRLELRQREITTKELEFTLIRTKAQNEFKGSVSLSLGLTGDDSKFTRIYDQSTQNPRVAISFSVPIFDWGANKARIRAQEVAMRSNTLDAHEEQLDIEMNIRQTCRSLQNLKTQVEIAEQNVNNAQLTYDLNLVRYRNGDISGMDFNQFQTQLSSKKSAYTRALINYKIELLNLKILSLYDFETNQEIVPLSDFSTKK
ncbi:MAG: TolC family protein [Dysgonamonadaceae bacterium]|jgi:outer membrane protein TolC|nr:TolC family protein [Dysgonamonadaceae bacterium]